MKLQKILFNFLTWGLLGYTAFAAFYSVLPEQYQHESFNTLTALISGTATGGIGGTLFYVKALLSKGEKSTNEKVNDVIEKFLGVLDYVKQLENEVATLKKENREQYVELVKEQKRTNQLLEIDLKAKLSNRLIDQEVKERISGVLDNEKDLV